MKLFKIQTCKAAKFIEMTTQDLNFRVKEDKPNEDFTDEDIQEIFKMIAQLPENEPVSLGERVTIEVTSEALGENFYLFDCTATNTEDEKITTDKGESDNPDFKSLQLVQGGCLQDINDLETKINPKLEKNGNQRILSFNQFGFAVNSKLTAKHQIKELSAPEN